MVETERAKPRAAGAGRDATRSRIGGLAAALAVGVLVPTAGGLAARLFAASWRWRGPALHSVFECSGAMLALGLAGILAALARQSPHETHKRWMAAALASMGLLDIVHASADGEAFAWFHTVGMLSGGAYFALVWVPDGVTRRLRWAPGAAVVAAVLASLVLTGLSAGGWTVLPRMLGAETFAPGARLLNALSGAGFLAASIRFASGYWARGRWDDLLFAVFCALSGSTGVLFAWSSPWGAEWWWWHAVHLTAFISSLFYLLRWYQATRARLEWERARHELAQERLARLQHRLTDSERLASIGTAAAVLAHEISNPLQAVSLNLSLLRERLSRVPVVDEMAETSVGRMGEVVAHLGNMLEDFRSVYRRQHLALAPMDVPGLVLEVLELEGEASRAAGVTVRRDLAADLPSILADRQKLRQALLNLYVNAVEAMPEGGVLTVSARPASGGVHLAIGDTGVGIPPGMDVFELFTTSKEKGTGLGLAITRQIVQAHGGSIRHESANGAGTTFIVELPVRPRAGGDG